MSPEPLSELGTQCVKTVNDALVAPAHLLAKILQPRAREIIVDQWNEFVENFHMDPLEFYELVHEELKRREVPGLQSFCVTHGEGGQGSAHRLYLRLERRWGKYDICAAPFGTGFFFSYRYIVPTQFGFWMKVFLGVLVIVAVTGGLMFTGLFGPGMPLIVAPVATLLWIVAVLSWGKDTYYRQDTSLMYIATVSELIKKLYADVILQAGARLEERVTSESAEA